MDASEINDWEWVGELIEESYRLIAPRMLVEELDGIGKLDSENPVSRKQVSEKPAVRKKK